MESGKGKFPASFDTYQLVRDGDLVFCLFDIDETPRTVGLSPLTGMITGAYSVFRPTPRAIGSFLSYFYHSIDDRKGLRPFYTGLRKVVRNDTFLSLPIPLPDLPTQKAIAAFLDRETARIDQLIEKKQRLMELLGERFKSAATAALTGATVDGDRQPSANPWIGTIPSTWRERRLSWCFRRIGSGTTPATGSFDRMYGEGTPWVTTSELREAPIAQTKQSVTHEALENYTALKVFPTGTLLIAMYGATIGRLGWLAMPATLNQACCALAEPESTSTRFIYHWLRTFRNDLVSLASGGGQPNLNQEKLRSLRIGIPSEQEAERIAQLLDNREVSQARLSERTKASIDRLKEYRSALITAAVTGQIDVETWSRRGAGDRRLDRIEEEMAG
ncbi:restriction endonuclease subunit S [Maricaulaceae bacterium NA33B04]|nr:restriction endonuclease subunit S [Maricaulaceae bacterium NA33B04]